MRIPVTFDMLRRVNVRRDKEWNTGSVPLTTIFRATELAGEAGEVCNVVKKLHRARIGIAGGNATVNDLRDELADVIIAADLLAMAEGIDLEEAVISKFNRTSHDRGFATLLSNELTFPPPEDGMTQRAVLYTLHRDIARHEAALREKYIADGTAEHYADIIPPDAMLGMIRYAKKYIEERITTTAGDSDE